MPLWKRLAYVAVTRAEERLVWVTRYALAPAERRRSGRRLSPTSAVARWALEAGRLRGLAQRRTRREGGGGEPAGAERERHRQQAVEPAARLRERL